MPFKNFILFSEITFKVQQFECLPLAKKSRVSNGLNGIYSKKSHFHNPLPRLPRTQMLTMVHDVCANTFLFTFSFSLTGSHEPPSGLVCGLFTYALWHELFFILFYFHHNFISSFAILFSYRSGAFRRIQNENIIKYLKTEHIMAKCEAARKKGADIA